MQALFTTPEILAATPGNLVQRGAAAAFCGVSTDSRTCQAGQLFIPLQGEHHDGHEYIPGALRRGVRGVLVQKGLLGSAAVGAGFKPAPTTPPEVTLIAVDDTLTALGDLARAWRDRFAIPVVGITGSCGKTTTKEMTAAVLSRRFQVLKNTLNLNNLIGLPATILGLDHGHGAAVVEMGMNRFGEIRRLTQICRPTVGMLINVHPAHTEGVGDVAGVALAKGELLEALEGSAVLVYNADDARIAALARDFPGRALGFGLKPGADLRAWGRRLRGWDGQVARLHYGGRSWTLNLEVAGLHQLYNALAATAAGLVLGLAPEETAKALAGFRAIHRRSQVQTLPSGVHLLNDCYNANPGSMAMALNTLQELRRGARGAAALGDMLELGNGAAQAHRDLGRVAAATGLDFLVIYGNFNQEVAAGAQEGGLAPARILPVNTRAEGARVLQDFLQPGDWLLVKGSRSMHMEGLIDLL
ncbi:MAG: UDP-N-acetylmuramoyl-tripeptide--D-alanyl-D-alanine ligase [Thermodesulfobacteriota bacterium]